jgi:hypothetical protein
MNTILNNMDLYVFEIKLLISGSMQELENLSHTAMPTTINMHQTVFSKPTPNRYLKTLLTSS